MLISTSRERRQTDEYLEFSYRPSFEDGMVIRLHRTARSEATCTVYDLLCEDTAKTSPLAPGNLRFVKELAVGCEEFESLVNALESSEFRRAEAQSTNVGLDGTSWQFLHGIDGRQNEFKFWTPERKKGTLAYALGMKFALIAHVEKELPSEYNDLNGGIPGVVNIDSFCEPIKQPPDKLEIVLPNRIEIKPANLENGNHAERSGVMVATPVEPVRK